MFRAADRVSQYMIREICYGGATGENLAFQIVAFRTFSKIETWDYLAEKLGHQPGIEDLRNGQFEHFLTELKRSGAKLYTGAFILCANDAYGRRLKHLNRVEMFKRMFLSGDLYDKIANAKSLAEVYDQLHTYPLMGDFMAYQIAIDLNYSELINFSENDFVKAGPGARRGIAKVFQSVGRMSPEEVIMWMVNRQKEELSRLNLDFDGLFGRLLHAIDCQNVFRETDKYCRVALPALASNRTRIKTHFRETTKPIQYYFPPKWHIR